MASGWDIVSEEPASANPYAIISEEKAPSNPYDIVSEEPANDNNPDYKVISEEPAPTVLPSAVGNITLPAGTKDVSNENIVERGSLLPIGKTESGAIVPALPEFAHNAIGAIQDIMQGNLHPDEVTGKQMFDIIQTLALGGGITGAGGMAAKGMIARPAISGVESAAPEAAASAISETTPAAETAAPKVDLQPAQVEAVNNLIDDGMERGTNALITSKPLQELRQAADKTETAAAPKETTQTVLEIKNGEQVSASPPKELPSSLTETIVKEPFSRDVSHAVIDLLDAGKVKLTPDIMIKDQVRDLLQTNIIDPDTFNAVLAKHGVTPEQFLAEVTQSDVGSAMEASFSKAGQILQQASEIRKAGLRIRALMGDQSEDVADFLKQNDDIGKGMMGLIKRANNAWRGMLVSQLGTAARNFMTQGANIGIGTLSRGIEQGFRTIFSNPARRIFGAKQATDPIDTFGLIASTFNPKRAAAITDAVTSISPKTRQSLFSRYMSDVISATGGRDALGKLEKASDWLNTLNRAQEYFYRKALFSEALSRRLASKGHDIDKLVSEGKSAWVGKALEEGDVKYAINAALDGTWAKDLPPRGNVMGDLLHGFAGIPFSPVPFVRFMVNGMKWQFEYSPLGATRLLSPKELNAGKFDQVTSKALAGSAMLYGAYLIRNSNAGGPKWYEINLPDTVAGYDVGTKGKKIDMRSYSPFSSYLFVADLIKRYQDGTLLGMDAKDIAQGIVGANFRAGAGLYMVDQLIDDLAGIDSVQKIGKIVKTYAGNVLAGYLTPFQMLKDAIGQFDPSERVVRDTKQSPLLGPSMSRVPYLDQNLPPAESPTHSGGYTREAPLLRQLTGVSIADKTNPAEDEINRLGLKHSEVITSSGDPVYDSLMAKHMGPLVEQKIGAMVQSDKYKAIDKMNVSENAKNKIKAEVMREALAKVRDEATKQTKADDNLAAFRKRYNSLPQRQRAVIEQVLKERGKQLNLNR